MATLKCALKRKNDSGSYDVVALQGSSDITYRPSGRTVEQDLNAYLPTVQSTDVVPDSIPFGKLVVGQNKAFLGFQNKISEISIGGKSVQYKTVAEYNALSEEEKMADVVYMIPENVDADINPVAYLPLTGGEMRGDVILQYNGYATVAIKMKNPNDSNRVAIYKGETPGEINLFGVDQNFNANETNRLVQLGGINAPIYDSDAANKLYVDTKARKSTMSTGIINFTMWEGSVAPYVAHFPLDGVDANSVVEIKPAAGITIDQFNAYQALNLCDGGQSTNEIILLAYGTKNETPIPIDIIIRGDM